MGIKMDQIKVKTENEVLVEQTERANRHAMQIEVGDHPILLHRDGRHESLERYLPEPRRKRGHACFTEPASFIDYVFAHAHDATVLMGEATEAAGGFRAIFNGPLPEKLCDADINEGGWGDFTAELKLETTVEWARWLGSNGKTVGQLAFAEFLEDNAADVIRPSGAELLEVAQTLQAAKSVNFRSGVRLRDGRNQLSFVEEIDARAGQAGQLEVPERFTIEIAPFIGAEPREIEARLRYRIDGGKLHFAYLLTRPHLVLAEAWTQVRTQIETATGRRVLRGTVASTLAATR